MKDWLFDHPISIIVGLMVLTLVVLVWADGLERAWMATHHCEPTRETRELPYYVKSGDLLIPVMQTQRRYECDGDRTKWRNE